MKTVSPLMSRVKEAARLRAEAYADSQVPKYCPEFDPHGVVNFGWQTTVDEYLLAADETAQFLLTELSRAEEGHGPRIFINLQMLLRSCRTTAYTTVDGGMTPKPLDAEYAPLSELIAARAAHAAEVEQLTKERNAALDMHGEYKEKSETRRIGRDRAVADLNAEREVRAKAEAELEQLRECVRLLSEPFEEKDREISKFLNGKLAAERERTRKLRFVLSTLKAGLELSISNPRNRFDADANTIHLNRIEAAIAETEGA